MILIWIAWISGIAYIVCDTPSLSFLDDRNLQGSASQIVNANNACIQIVKSPESGSLYDLAIVKNSIASSTLELRFAIKNTCTAPVSLDGIAVVIRGLFINKKNVASITSRNIVSPWLIMSDYQVNQNYLSFRMSSPQCKQEFCNWTLLMNATSTSIVTTAQYSGKIDSYELKELFIADNPPTSNLELIVGIQNIHYDFTNPINVNVKIKCETKPDEIYRFTVSTERASFSVINIPRESTIDITVDGIVLPLQELVYEPISYHIDHLSSENCQVKLNYVLSSTTRAINVNSRSYTGEFLPSLDFSVVGYSCKRVSLKNREVRLIFPNVDITPLHTALVPKWYYKANLDVIKVSQDTLTVIYSEVSNPSFKFSGYIQSPYIANSLTTSKSPIANMPSYITRINIAFINPNNSYVKGSYKFNEAGLSFRADASIVIEAIKQAKRNNPNLKVLLSAGGGTYKWKEVNYEGLNAAMIDLGADGIDIDFENSGSCTNANTDLISCTNDESLISHIKEVRRVLGSDKLITVASSPVGAYGTTDFPTTLNWPSGPNAGSWVVPMRKIGSFVDEMFLMTYDADLKYNPKDAFDAYKKIYKGKIYIGLEVPPEGWGNHEFSLSEAIEVVDYAYKNNGEGVFIWALNKEKMFKNGTPVNAYYYYSTLCKIYGFEQCDNPIPSK